MWNSLLENMEVAGFGVYGRWQNKLGVVVLGNHFEDGVKQPVSVCSPSGFRDKCPFPGGPFETPLSVVSFDIGIMVIASSPFIVDSKEKKGKELKLPCLWLFQPHKNPHPNYNEREQWIRSIPFFRPRVFSDSSLLILKLYIINPTPEELKNR